MSGSASLEAAVRDPPSHSSEPADFLAVEDLVVVYSDGTRAVDGISFRVKAGEFFGFLGPNGAGKSTTIKALTTLLRKAAGRVSVAGFDLDRSAPQIRGSIGVLSQETTLDVDLTGRENLLLFGKLQHVERSLLDRRVEELLRVVQLEDVADKPAGRYSGGMRKRLDLASALVHRPRLLFLDEPTTGLDPQSRAAMWDYLQMLNREEKVTIFLTTQYMEEADRLCQRIAIIDHGRIIGGGSPAELKAALGGDTVSVVLDPKEGLELQVRAQRVLSTVRGVTQVRATPEGVAANAPNAGSVLAAIVTALERENIRPSTLSVSTPTLDDVFLRLTGRKIRAEELGRKIEEPFVT